jgi:glycosyltransferase involved in cell wall biosynthesis
MISVVHVIWSGNFGGIETLVSDLCAAQKNNPKLKVELLIGKKSEATLQKLSEQDILVHFAELKSGSDFSFSKYNNLKNFFSRFDIIHIHSYNALVAYAAVRSGKKIVFTEHGNFGFGRRKKFSDVVNYFLLKKFLKKHVDFISFNSKFTKQIAGQRYHLTGKKSEVIYNGINFSNQSAAEITDDELKKKLDGKFIIGTSSRFAGFKRIDRLIKAFAEFQKSKDTFLLLVGDGVKRKELELLVSQHSITDKTIFTGYRKDVRQLQQLMDVCVFPSENEPFGLVAIEALSLGKPVLVFRDGGGMAELIVQTSEEDVVEDVDALVSRMNFYFENRDRIETGVRNRIQFAKTFDIKMMEEKFFDIYNTLA